MTRARPSEDAMIARYFAPLAGPGAFGLRDDAAVATPRAGHDLVVTTDMLVAGVHFFADDAPGAIARKALRVNLSDLAAKAATPKGILLSLALPHDWTETWLESFCDGFRADCSLFRCALLGGDTVATPGPLAISITAFGEVPIGRMVPRTGARAGDALYVSGTIGDAALGLHLRWRRQDDEGWIDAVDAPSREALLQRHRQPEPRLALKPALREHARAAMDVSDGFVGDLAKMLRLEGLSASIKLADVPFSPATRSAVEIKPALVKVALTGGDDYEIICAVDVTKRATFEAAARRAGVAVTCFGRATADGGSVTVVGSDGPALDLGETSFQHFA